MKKGFRKILLLGISALMALSAAGCGGAPQPEGSATSTPIVNGNGLSDTITPISIVNDTHSDKVKETATFTLPDNPVKYPGRFTISPAISSGMVLQANMPVRVWGQYVKDGKIAAKLTETKSKDVKIYYGEVKNGWFEIYLGATGYGGPYNLDLVTEDGALHTFEDILFGEVYLLGGQSNMGWSMGQCYDGSTDKLLYQDIIDQSENDSIRHFLVWPKSSERPVDELSQNEARPWTSVAPSNIKDVSAVGYFFAKEINEKYNIPVGIMACCMGGTSIYTWFPLEDAERLAFDQSKTPSIWYNSMVHPLRKMTVRGTLWYQGEGHGEGYAELLADLVTDWRRVFETPEMYFATVQMPRSKDEQSYFISREEHKKATTLVDNMTYSVNIDTGLYPENAAKGDSLNVEGVHPYDKKAVGTRLAHAVMGKFYGAAGVWRGPVLESAKLENNQVQLTFSGTGTGLTLTGELAGFEVCGADGSYYDAVPALASDASVVLTCDAVSDPQMVRYGYKNKSSLITKPLTSCEQSVCLYNTKGPDKEVAYPAEQFLVKIEK